MDIGHRAKQFAPFAALKGFEESVRKKEIIYESTDVYSHIIDDDRRRNAEMFEDAFYGKQDLDPQLRKGESGENIMTVPEGVDAELLAKVLANPEMTALLTSLAKTMK